jgi:hypothetical protein
MVNQPIIDNGLLHLIFSKDHTMCFNHITNCIKKGLQNLLSNLFL